MMAEARVRTKGDTVAVKMKVIGGGVGRREGRGSETKAATPGEVDQFPIGVKMKRRWLLLKALKRFKWR